ncbi:hypothetical protein FQN54_007441 [Arachnomyces sp. PD_36]|nr:hypothetical protein FQN54_007441 [Arachnomyces sp. PD_36]
MASSPSSQSLVKRQSDNALMPPPPPPKRIKRPPKVLEEDAYTDALSHIIARDFFPGLLETQSQQEYLDALDSKDRRWIATAGRKLSEVMTPGPAGARARERRGVSMTPRAGSATPTPTPQRGGETPRGWVGDTPASVAGSELSTASSLAAKTEDDEARHMGLGAFQGKYTSEDNESFNKLLDKQNVKRREKYSWMWNGNKVTSARQIAHRQREAKRISAQGDSDNKNKDKQLMITSDSDARPAQPESWKTGPENSLMFTPSSVEDTHETIQQKAETSSRAGAKQVIHGNTRIQPISSATETDDENNVPPSPSVSAIRDAIAGRPRPTDSEPGYTGGETPRVAGYAFVDEDEPEPDDDQYNDPQFQLKLLSSQVGVDSASNPFNIKENRKREDLHHRMVDRVAKNNRSVKVARETKTPVPKFPSSPMMNFGRTPGAGKTPVGGSVSLTPAARMLWEKVGSTPRRSAKAGSTAGASKGNMWTPTPKRKK